MPYTKKRYQEIHKSHWNLFFSIYIVQVNKKLQKFARKEVVDEKY